MYPEAFGIWPMVAHCSTVDVQTVVEAKPV
jgi:hypothetical protein